MTEKTEPQKSKGNLPDKLHFLKLSYFAANYEDADPHCGRDRKGHDGDLNNAKRRINEGTIDRCDGNNHAEPSATVASP